MSRDDRRVRYGSAAGLIVLGFACGAISTGTVGGALATVFIAVGMILFLVFLLRDLGLTDRPARSGRGATRPPVPSPHAAPHRHPGEPAGAPRTHASVTPPERLRGQRRRLR